MSRWSTLLPLLLVGCWPYIPGPYVAADLDPDSDTDRDTDWDTDVDTDTDTDTDVDTDTDTRPMQDEVLLTGLVSRRDYLGGYWSDNAPLGQVILGWEDLDAGGVQLVSDLYASPGRCVVNATLADWQGGLDPEGPGAVLRLRGSASAFSVPVDPDLGLWLLDGSDVAGQLPAGARLSILDGRADGLDLATSELLRMPPALAFAGPVLDGETVSILAATEVGWSWSSRPAGVQHVMLDVLLVDAQSTPLESITCVETLDAGRIRVPSSMLGRISETEYAIVSLSAVSQAGSTVADGVDAEVLALTTRVGVVLFE